MLGLAESRGYPPDIIPGNLWRPSGNVPLRVQPIDNKPGMYKLVPNADLHVGKYALYFPNSLHANGIVFTASAGQQATALAFEIVRADTFAPTNGSTKAQFSGGMLHFTKSDGSIIALSREVANLRYAFGGKKMVDVDRPRSPTRVTRHEKDYFLVSTPPGGWENTSLYRIYVFEVKNGKRTAMINRSGPTVACSVERFGSEGRFMKITPERELRPGEYAFGPRDPQVPLGGGTMAVTTFGVDSSLEDLEEHRNEQR
jgi:hypothetical protein